MAQMPRTGTAQAAGCLAMVLLHAAAPAARAEGEGIAVAGAVSPAVAQQSAELRGTRLDYATVPVALGIELPLLDLAEVPPVPRTPRRIGIHRKPPPEFAGDLAGRLRWTQLADGSVVTSIKLRSPAAVSVRLGLVAKLPAGGEIRLFHPSDPGRQLPRVAVGDLIGERGGTELVWLPSVEGEAVGIEISLPSWESTESLSLTLERIAHRYASAAPKRVPGERSDALKCPGQYVDVLCRADEFSNGQENAVGRITFESSDGSRACSGTLLNDNSPGDFQPYFLTANHCVGTAAVARSVEVDWFYQRESCDSWFEDRRRSETGGGADLLATSVAQDSSLIRLRGVLPGGLWFAGWSARHVTHPVAVHNISHPAAGPKKFASGWTTKTTDVRVDDFTVRRAYEVAWDVGGTEGGSSGSGLFDGDYLIGVLSGGEDVCGGRAVFGSFRDFYPRIRRWMEATANGDPDLVVDSPSVDDDALRTGQRFSFSAVVQNRGGRRSAATTLR